MNQSILYVLPLVLAMGLGAGTETARITPIWSMSSVCIV